ncbi:hypothetical protein HXX76_004983 [Chlamydomonas incerta]|uniref:Uncharacterized protein n=1 Tax=Chlamydomonas incerta TaxID=51695 RepID=A0A835W8F8_CHLIN|nr:hypothetical protein HXX76_004983 [Chlamydomonas incerta]|eukprot:KAG2439631.1 hypothetical protein HXX76_004983 [Chlamydomonas incerta]
MEDGEGGGLPGPSRPQERAPEQAEQEPAGERVTRSRSRLQGAASVASPRLPPRGRPAGSRRALAPVLEAETASGGAAGPAAGRQQAGAAGAPPQQRVSGEVRGNPAAAGAPPALGAGGGRSQGNSQRAHHPAPGPASGPAAGAAGPPGQGAAAAAAGPDRLPAHSGPGAGSLLGAGQGEELEGTDSGGAPGAGGSRGRGPQGQGALQGLGAPRAAGSHERPAPAGRGPGCPPRRGQGALQGLGAPRAAGSHECASQGRGGASGGGADPEAEPWLAFGYTQREWLRMGALRAEAQAALDRGMAHAEATGLICYNTDGTRPPPGMRIDPLGRLIYPRPAADRHPELQEGPAWQQGPQPNKHAPPPPAQPPADRRYMDQVEEEDAEAEVVARQILASAAAAADPVQTLARLIREGSRKRGRGDPAAAAGGAWAELGSADAYAPEHPMAAPPAPVAGGGRGAGPGGGRLSGAGAAVPSLNPLWAPAAQAAGPGAGAAPGWGGAAPFWALRGSGGGSSGGGGAGVTLEQRQEIDRQMLGYVDSECSEVAEVVLQGMMQAAINAVPGVEPHALALAIWDAVFQAAQGPTDRLSRICGGLCVQPPAPSWRAATAPATTGETIRVTVRNRLNELKAELDQHARVSRTTAVFLHRAAQSLADTDVVREVMAHLQSMQESRQLTESGARVMRGFQAAVELRQLRGQAPTREEWKAGRIPAVVQLARMAAELERGTAETSKGLYKRADQDSWGGGGAWGAGAPAWGSGGAGVGPPARPAASWGGGGGGSFAGSLAYAAPEPSVVSGPQGPYGAAGLGPYGPAAPPAYHAEHRAPQPPRNGFPANKDLRDDLWAAVRQTRVGKEWGPKEKGRLRSWLRAEKICCDQFANGPHEKCADKDRRCGVSQGELLELLK